MWCADCQQDVPAVARSASEPLMCPRCQRELDPVATCVPSDAGIELESFDRPSTEELAPPVDWFKQEQTLQRLREIDHKLNSSSRSGTSSAVAPILQRTWSNLSSPPLASPPVASNLEPPRRTASGSAIGQRRTRTSWLLSFLLGVGVVVFCVGLGLLGWSAALELPQLWHQGMTLTIGAEGLLILSLTWMALRLWRNSRRVNRQLYGVDRQLAEIEQITGALAGSHSRSSQHFYHHFSQVASPHMMVANLQGQVDQLAARMAAQ